ncbi:MAG: PAS domain-containing protein [Candidatus Liptonbacteria bacterium]|nr:PAS domain-containing protein [Candidatus Liptonbacteria bacterium]
MEKSKIGVWVTLAVFLVLASLNFVFPRLVVAALTLISGLFLVFIFPTFLKMPKETVSSVSIKESSIEDDEFKNIVLHLRDALILYDRNFKFIFFNPAAEELFRVPAASVLGREFKPQDAEELALRRLVQVIFPSLAPIVVSRSPAGVYPQIIDISFEDPTLELQVTTTPLRIGEGGPTAFMKIVRDRTSEVSLVKAKSEFVTLASHQLRGPVTDINWALETLAGETGLSETGKSILQSTKKASGQLIGIIEDLISVSKIEEGRFGYEFESKDIVDVLGRILSSVMAKALRAGVKVYFDRPKESLPQVLIDENKLTLAFYNFLENAIRYNIKNGEVIVKVEKVKDKPFLEIKIKDTGIGIPPDEIDKIFFKFFRARNALKFKTEGSGLGLYIAKNIIRAHGGQVQVESELNRGSTFHFTLPTDPNLVPKHEVAIEE